MLKELCAAVSSLANATVRVINSVANVTDSIDNVVSATNHATKALDLTAEGLENDVVFEQEQKTIEREAAIKAFKESLNELDN